MWALASPYFKSIDLFFPRLICDFGFLRWHLLGVSPLFARILSPISLDYSVLDFVSHSLLNSFINKYPESSTSYWCYRSEIDYKYPWNYIHWHLVSEAGSLELYISSRCTIVGKWQINTRNGLTLQSYVSHERNSRVAIIFGGAALSGAFGGIIKIIYQV